MSRKKQNEIKNKKCSLKIEIGKMKVKLSGIRKHPNNPRLIKDADFQSLKKSIILFPEMQTARPMVVNSSNQIIGGNQRRRAFQDIAGMTLDEISAVIGTSTTPIEPERVTFLIEFWDTFKTEKTVEVHKVDWSEAKQKEFMIKDNVSNGEWDYNELANSWDSLELNDWGVGVWDASVTADSVEEVESFNECVSFIIKCRDTSELEELQSKLGCDGKKLDYGVFVSKVGI